MVCMEGAGGVFCRLLLSNSWLPFCCASFLEDSGREGMRLVCPGSDALPTAADVPADHYRFEVRIQHVKQGTTVPSAGI